MAALEALSLAATVVQFVDFASKLVSKGYHVYRSADGALPHNLEMEAVAKDLSYLTVKLRSPGSLGNPSALTEDERALEELAEKCNEIATTLLGRLDKLKVKKEERHRGWKSVRQALKSVWNKRELDDLARELSSYRDQLQFSILLSMKGSNEFLANQQFKRFDILDTDAGNLLEELLNNRSVFKSTLQTQALTITQLHLETKDLIRRESHQTRSEIISAIRDSAPGRTRLQGKITRSPPDCKPDWADIILDSLRFPTMRDRYEGIESAHKNTFKWIFHEAGDWNKPWDGFSQWLKAGDGIYWVSGKAGSGKSTLMRYIIDNPLTKTHLQNWAKDSNQLIVAGFFFWISGAPDQSSQVGLFRSLLFELLSSRRHLIKFALPELWEELATSVDPVLHSKQYTWTIPKATKAFHRLFLRDIGHVFLLIDGLDEYQGDPKDTLTHLRSIISPKVKICLSSRPWQVFEEAFKNVPKLRLQDLTFDDIRKFVNDELFADEKMQELCTIEPVEAPKLVNELVMKSDGVFLWVSLVVKSLLNGLTNGDRISFLRRRLEEIPSKIESLYRYMLLQIESIYHEEGWQLFSIASLAFHDESLYSGDGIDAVHMSLAIDEGIDSIMSTPIHLLTEKEVTRRVQWINIRLKVSCAGLLELNQWSIHVPLGEFGNLKIQYIHRTARDFLATLDAQKTPIGKFHSTTYHVPTRLLKANVAYIKSCFKLSSHHRDELTLLTPIIKRTMWLASKAELETGHDEFEVLRDLEYTLTKSFGPSVPWSHFMAVNKSSGLAATVPIHERDRQHHWQDDFVSLAILWRLNRYLAKTIGKSNMLLEKKKGRQYLDYAILKIGIPGGLSEGLWDLDIIQLLLQYGCNLNQVFGKHVSPWQYVLRTVQTRLLSQNIYVQAEDFEIYFRAGGTRPHTSCSTYLGSLFELMIKHGADPYASITCQESPAGEKKSFSALEIISCPLATSPEDVACLVALLPKSSLFPDLPLPSDQPQSDLPLPPPKSLEGRFARFKLKVGFGK